MALDKIGSVQFDLIGRPGHVHGLARRAVLFERSGVHGHGAVGIGKRGPRVDWPACYKWLSSWANAVTHIVAVEALRGTVVTVYDSGASQYDNMMVEEAQAVGGPQAVLQNGTTKYQTVCRIVMRQVSA